MSRAFRGGEKEVTKKKTRFRLTKFDKDLLSYLSDGPATKKELLAKTRVAESEFDKRAKKLKAKKYVVFEGEQLALGVQGYNKVKKMEEAAKRREAKKLKEQAGKLLESARQPEEKEPEPAREKPSPAPAEKRDESPSNAIDLAEILKNANRRTKEQKQETKIEKAPWPPKQADEPEPKEKCELCKGPFSLSVSNKSGAKYGHCFCGAAYHKDCYEAIMAGDKRCVRCGRKLELYLDKESEAAVRSIRDAFD